MQEIRKNIEGILKSHNDRKQQLKALEYELGLLQQTLRPETIEGKVYAHYGGERVSGAQPSDKTADIVIEHFDRQRDARYHALKSVTYTMGIEVRRLEHYLSLIPSEESDIIRWCYFEGLSWAEIAQRTALTIRTLQRRRKHGLDGLIKLYSTVDSLPLNGTDARTYVRFVSYVHEERYVQCLERMKGSSRNLGIEAMAYLIAGCNELWDAGIDSFLNFETWELMPQEDRAESFSTQGAKLFRLACCFAREVAVNRLSHYINGYFPGLEHLHLELAIEAIRLVLFSSMQ